MKQYFSTYRTELKDTIDKIDESMVEKLYELLNMAKENGKRIFVLGNGGSAAAASHWVCDFGKGINVDNSKRMKISSPSDACSIVTAIGNDFSYGDIFSEQLRNFLEAGDLVISLSVSGNSQNLVRAHEFAKKNGAVTAAIIGDYNGKLAMCSDLVLTIPSKNYGIVEDIHLCIDHAISQYMRLLNERK